MCGFVTSLLAFGKLKKFGTIKKKIQKKFQKKITKLFFKIFGPYLLKFGSGDGSKLFSQRMIYNNYLRNIPTTYCVLDQTRPDQTRPDQTQTDPTLPDLTRTDQIS